MKTIFLILLFLSPLTIHSETEKQTFPQICIQYNAATVTEITPKYIRIKHADGESPIFIKDLPLHVKKKLNLLTAEEKKQSEKKKHSATVLQVLSNGLLLEQKSYIYNTLAERRTIYLECVPGDYIDGSSFKYNSITRNGTFQYTTVAGAKKTIAKYTLDD